MSNYQDNLQITAQRVAELVALHRSVGGQDVLAVIDTPEPRILYASDLEFICGDILDRPGA